MAQEERERQLRIHLRQSSKMVEVEFYRQRGKMEKQTEEIERLRVRLKELEGQLAEWGALRSFGKTGGTLQMVRQLKTLEAVREAAEQTYVRWAKSDDRANLGSLDAAMTCLRNALERCRDSETHEE